MKDIWRQQTCQVNFYCYLRLFFKIAVLSTPAISCLAKKFAMQNFLYNNISMKLGLDTYLAFLGRTDK